MKAVIFLSSWLTCDGVSWGEGRERGGRTRLVVGEGLARHDGDGEWDGVGELRVECRMGVEVD
jgi:hypothetical protein